MWYLNLDGRRDRDGRAKTIVGCGTGPAGDHVAVFSLVHFQENDCFGGGLMGVYGPGAQRLLDAGGCQDGENVSLLQERKCSLF